MAALLAVQQAVSNLPARPCTCYRARMTQTPPPFDPPDIIHRKACEEWAKGIREIPAGPADPILGYSVACGGPSVYEANGDLQWCGFFAGAMAIRAGVHPVHVRQKTPPESGGTGSTYRLYRLADRYPECRISDPTMVRPGDIVVVGYDYQVTLGSHIVVAGPQRADGAFDTVEGNAYGYVAGYPSDWLEGVVRSHRAHVATATKKGFKFGFRFDARFAQEVV